MQSARFFLAASTCLDLFSSATGTWKWHSSQNKITASRPWTQQASNSKLLMPWCAPEYALKNITTQKVRRRVRHKEVSKPIYYLSPSAFSPNVPVNETSLRRPPREHIDVHPEAHQGDSSGWSFGTTKCKTCKNKFPNPFSQIGSNFQEWQESLQSHGHQRNWGLGWTIWGLPWNPPCCIPCWSPPHITYSKTLCRVGHHLSHWSKTSGWPPVRSGTSSRETGSLATQANQRQHAQNKGHAPWQYFELLKAIHCNNMWNCERQGSHLISVVTLPFLELQASRPRLPSLVNWQPATYCTQEPGYQEVSSYEWHWTSTLWSAPSIQSYNHLRPSSCSGWPWRPESHKSQW